jgi:hypothetical protein
MTVIVRRRAPDGHWAHEEDGYLYARVEIIYDGDAAFGRVVGKNKAFSAVFGSLVKLGPADLPPTGAEVGP